VLTFLKMAIAPDRGTTELWKVITNRFLAIFAIGMTTFLGILRRRAEQERERADERLREHQAALAHMGRLTLLGQVAASVAHELNQPLAAIRLNAELAGRTVANEPRTELAGQLRELSVQSARAGDIVHSIRRLARRSAFDPAPVDMNEVVATAAKLLEWRMKRAGIAIHIERQSESCLAFGDRIQLEQVIVNLLQNALESLASQAIPSKMIVIHIDQDGDQITVRVHDNGPGLAAGIALFEPFTTTKPDGLGLGLAICQSIVEAHGGRITGANLARGGAEFSLTLPTAAKGQR
jgi:C4-dicarboxylate-specific signal transduction histidine kinase